jgi:hypothetical protein
MERLTAIVGGEPGHAQPKESKDQVKTKTRKKA